MGGSSFSETTDQPDQNYAAYTTNQVAQSQAPFQCIPTVAWYYVLYYEVKHRD